MLRKTQAPKKEVRFGWARLSLAGGGKNRYAKGNRPVGAHAPFLFVYRGLHPRLQCIAASRLPASATTRLELRRAAAADQSSLERGLAARRRNGRPVKTSLGRKKTKDSRAAGTACRRGEDKTPDVSRR